MHVMTGFHLRSPTCLLAASDLKAKLELNTRSLVRLLGSGPLRIDRREVSIYQYIDQTNVMIRTEPEMSLRTDILLGFTCEPFREQQDQNVEPSLVSSLDPRDQTLNTGHTFILT